MTGDLTGEPAPLTGGPLHFSAALGLLVDAERRLVAGGSDPYVINLLLAAATVHAQLADIALRVAGHDRLNGMDRDEWRRAGATPGPGDPRNASNRVGGINQGR